MNVIKKNFYHILFFVVGVVLLSYAFKLYAFGVDYETEVTRPVMLVDTASTTTKVKQTTHYNTTGYFIEVSTGKNFRLLSKINFIVNLKPVAINLLRWKKL